MWCTTQHRTILVIFIVSLLSSKNQQYESMRGRQLVIVSLATYLFCLNTGMVSGKIECERAGRTIRRRRMVTALLRNVWRQRILRCLLATWPVTATTATATRATAASCASFLRFVAAGHSKSFLYNRCIDIITISNINTYWLISCTLIVQALKVWQ